MSDNSGKPPFDQRIADGYVGKYILVGITFLDHEGKETRRIQVHGVIEEAAPDGIRIRLRGAHDGQWCTIPPDLRAISTARPGIYTLHETGERVENPDLLTKWRFQEEPPRH